MSIGHDRFASKTRQTLQNRQSIYANSGEIGVPW